MLKLMFVLAHPDDESLAMGGTIAHYTNQGIETSLVVATRGERGWFGRPQDYPGEEALGRIREREVRAAGQELGISHLAFLDYLDGELDSANALEATARIVRLLRQFRPNVVVTFGPEGLYGHPDHIAISQLTTSAVICSADQGYPFAQFMPPHRVAKLYYRAGTRSWFEAYMPVFGELIMQIDGQERRAHPWTGWTITTRLDTSEHWRQVWRAVRCHQTQIPPAHALRKLEETDHRRLWGPQEYYRAYSLVNGGRAEETDLFEGLRPACREESTAGYSLLSSLNV